MNEEIKAEINFTKRLDLDKPILLYTFTLCLANNGGLNRSLRDSHASGALLLCGRVLLFCSNQILGLTAVSEGCLMLVLW